MHRERVRTIRNRVARLAVITFSVLIAMSGVSVLADDPPFVATNAVVIDADTGHVLFARNMHAPVYPGDLTKIVTAIVALESAAVDTQMTVAEADLVGEVGIGLRAGEELSLETLLFGMLLNSADDAALTIARSLGELPDDSADQSVERFMTRVNTTVGRLGLENTNLTNPHGEDEPGHVASAADLAAITMLAMNNPFFREIFSAPYAYREGHEFYNNNRFKHRYSGLVGGMTSSSEARGYSSMQIAERDGRTIIAVLLGSSNEYWMSDATYLIEAGFAELERAPDDAGRPVVGLISPEIQVPELTMPETPEAEDDVQDSVGGSVQAPQPAESEADEPPSSAGGGLDPLSWEWPVFLAVAILAVVAIALGLTRVLGSRALAFEHGSVDQTHDVLAPPPDEIGRPMRPVARSRPPVGTRPMLQTGTTQTAQFQESPATAASPTVSVPSYGVRDVTRPTGPPRSATTEAPQTGDSPARSLAGRAIVLATQSQYQNAAQTFKQVFELDPEIDLASLPGFQRMQPMGYIAVAKGYVLNGQHERARDLLIVTQKTFDTNPDLKALFGRAIRALEVQPSD